MAIGEPTTERRGLALPAVKTHGGYFAAKDRYDLAWSQLLIALFVPFGSRPMRRSFGSPLHTVVFDPMRLDDPMIEYMVRSVAESNCPNVAIRAVHVRPDAFEPKLHIFIEFGLADEEGGVVRQFDFDRADTMRALGV